PGVTQAIADERGAHERAALPARERRLDGLPRLGVPAFLVVGAGDRGLGGDPLQAGLRDVACEPRLGGRTRPRVLLAPPEIPDQVLRERPAVREVAQQAAIEPLDGRVLPPAQ